MDFSDEFPVQFNQFLLFFSETEKKAVKSGTFIKCLLTGKTGPMMEDRAH